MTDNRSTNRRVDCSFCKTSILSRDFGNHLLKKHEDRLFDPGTKLGQDNIKELWRDKAVKEPIAISFTAHDELYFCLADNSGIKRKNLAEIHLKKNQSLHKENLMRLRDKYPRDGEVADDTQLSPSIVDAIQEVVWVLMDRIRKDEFVHDAKPTPNLHKKLKLLEKIPFALDEKTLKEKFDPDEPEEEEEVKEEVQEEVEEEIKEVVKEKKPILHPVVKMLRDMMNDKGFSDEEKRDVIREQVRRHKLSDPMLETFLEKHPEPIKKELSKEEIQEVRKLLSPEQKPKPQLASYSNFTAPPSQPQFPKILASTKRS